MVKIWDQAAKNVSEAGISQVERYCDYLSRKYARSNWRFIYLIPTFDSPKCLSEFEKAYCKDYKENLRLMAWNPTNEESLVTSKFMAGTLVEKSVAAMIAEILENKEVKRTDIPLNTNGFWIPLQGCHSESNGRTSRTRFKGFQRQMTLKKFPLPGESRSSFYVSRRCHHQFSLP
jgi:hypothetical protein